MLIKYENTTIKMNNANDQLKSRSETEFSINDFRTSPLYSSRLRVEVLNCLPNCKRKTDKLNDISNV